jgi:hypothetical protein
MGWMAVLGAIAKAATTVKALSSMSGGDSTEERHSASAGGNMMKPADFGVDKGFYGHYEVKGTKKDSSKFAKL